MPPQRIAVVDLGTNSTRLLVAGVDNGSIEELERRTDVTRLGEGVDATGRLSEAAIERVFSTLAEYRELADRHRPHTVVAVATSAVRDAANGEQFRSELARRFGIDARTIPGEEEARLTFRGATAARAAGPAETLVLDIGGGSTEFVEGRPGAEPGFHISASLGSVRHTERHLPSDPPSPEELGELRHAVRGTVESEVPADVRKRVDRGIAVAGTATSLAAIDLELDPYDPCRVDGYELTLPAAERILRRLAELPLAERRDVTGLHPGRAPTIVAGAMILVQSVEAFGLASIEISEADILHGAALAAAEEEAAPPGGDKRPSD
jgi:exopolyphosphatase / guanosine-5'-triphosphate,3'-diphosphate pyrophosphatase